MTEWKRPETLPELVELFDAMHHWSLEELLDLEKKLDPKNQVDRQISLRVDICKLLFKEKCRF